MAQGPGHVGSVVGMMKMGNIVPKLGFESKSLAFQVSVLPLHHIGSLLSPLYPRLPVCAAPCLRGKCTLVHTYELSHLFNWVSLCRSAREKDYSSSVQWKDYSCFNQNIQNSHIMETSYWCNSYVAIAGHTWMLDQCVRTCCRSNKWCLNVHVNIKIKLVFALQSYPKITI